MNNFSDVVGSMPSTPQRPPATQQPQTEQTESTGGFVGLLLCAVALFGFSIYVHTDPLGTGIFAGISLMLLLIALIGLWSSLAGRTKGNRLLAPPRSATPPAEIRRTRKWGIIGVTIFLLLLGVFLLTFPKSANMGSLSTELNLAGLLVLLLDFIILCFTAFRLSREEKQEKAKQEQKPRSNGIGSSLVVLFVGIVLLAFPRQTGMVSFAQGMVEGVGLTLLLLAIMALSSIIPKYRSPRS